MAFSVFVPPAATPEAPAPCIFYLSGLTCTDENFPARRGAGVDGEDDAYDFGSGAGFYVDATAAPWRDNYNMYSYVTEELVAAVRDAAPAVDVGRRSITGHSMGGAGALTIAMKAPETWTSVSAFSPICNPTRVPWGKKAFEGYLGSVEAGAAHDASELVRKGGPFAFGDILISQGADDDFLVGDVDQLQPEAFRAACDSVGQGLELRYEAGYDHSYFFIATFVDQHVNFHADRVLAR
ncbi:S-formylglutathione hydrolase [Aureococcus anophagefferens]|nr:S-formylglutathione hydrolase [Aureococcus anophagefferens]